LRAAENASHRLTLPPDAAGSAAGRLVRSARRPAAVRYSFHMHPGAGRALRGGSVLALLAAAILVGVTARIAFLAEKPLWSDEIFTLTLARQPAAEIVEALRLDSGPPLHYVLARLVLLPLGASPGPSDIAVRILSLAASLLHLPLLVLVARRLGRPEAGLPAAALYALFPIAVDYAAEGRAYAIASLLVLAAFERALALREQPTAGRAVALAFATGGAVLFHYLALFPVAGLAALFPSSTGRTRRLLTAAGGGGALLFLPWLPVALRQPSASMAWSREAPFAMAPLHLPVNLGFGISPLSGGLALLVPLSLLVLGAALFAAWRSAFRPVAAVFLAGVSLLLLAHLVLRAVLLPERSAVLFLPLVALLLAGAPRPVPLLSAAASLVGLVLSLRSMAAPSPGETLAGLVRPLVAEGRSVCATGLWGPELDYRLARAGLPGRVVLFPSDVVRHRGWYHEEEAGSDRLLAEARALAASSSRPALFVLPRGSRAADALRAALGPLVPRPVAGSPLVEVLEVPGPSPAGTRLAVPSVP